MLGWGDRTRSALRAILRGCDGSQVRPHFTQERSHVGVAPRWSCGISPGVSDTDKADLPKENTTGPQAGLCPNPRKRVRGSATALHLDAHCRAPRAATNGKSPALRPGFARLERGKRYRITTTSGNADGHDATSNDGDDADDDDASRFFRRDSDRSSASSSKLAAGAALAAGTATAIRAATATAETIFNIRIFLRELTGWPPTARIVSSSQ